MKARISAGSFTPCVRSTPEDTSTADVPVTRIASATLSTVRPPARIHGAGARQPRSSDQSNRTALPPGRVAPGGGLASTSKPVGPASFERQIGGSRHAHRAPDRQTEAGPQRGNIRRAVELQDVEPHSFERSGDRLRRRIDEQAHARRTAG